MSAQAVVTSDIAEVPSVPAVVEVAAKPAFQPYYKAPSQIDVSKLVFTMKPERVQSGPIKTTTFAIGIKNPEVELAAQPVAPPVPGKGGRGGGRGGRGGRGAQVAKLGALAIKPTSSLRSKYGINFDINNSNGTKDKEAVLRPFKENPRLVNAMAAGMHPIPDGLHFEILFFLDPNDEEHQLLEQLSIQCRESFEEFTYSLAPGMVKAHLVTNGFVRVSAKTDERYIVLSLSTMHTVEQSKFYPTPFYDQKNEVILWDALVNHSARANIEFKVSHVMMVGGDKASFKSYLSSCTLIEEPKIALSESRQTQEAYLRAVKESVEKTKSGPAAETLATTEGSDLDAAESQLAALVVKAKEVSSRTRPHTAVKAEGVRIHRVKKEVQVAAPPQEDVDEEHELSPPQEIEDDEGDKTPVPNGMISNLARKRA